MFETTLPLLLAGRFVCETTAPEAFRYLEQEGAREEVDAYLRRIGRRLARTEGGQAFYMAFAQIDESTRQEVRKQFADIKHEIRPVIDFIELVMQALRQEAAPSPGERFDFPALLNAINTEPQLANELANFPSYGRQFVAPEATTRAMLDKLIEQLVKSGYLTQIDRTREVYAFTGKIEFFLEVIEFLIEHEKTAGEDAEEEEPEQLRMPS